MKNSLNLFLIFLLIMACRDNNVEPPIVVQPPIDEELNPPPENSPFFVADAFSPSGKKSLAWSIDLSKWEYWNNGFGIGRSIVERNGYIIYLRNSDSQNPSIFYTEDGFKNSFEYKNAPVSNFEDAIWENNILVLVEGAYNLYYTKDFGENWIKKEFDSQFYEIEFVNDYFLIFGNNNMHLKSSDCEIWTANDDFGYYPTYYDLNEKVYYPGNQFLYVSEIGSVGFEDSISVKRNLNSNIETMFNCHFIVDEAGITALGTFRDAAKINAYLGKSDLNGINWDIKQTFLPESEINNFPNLPRDYPGFSKAGDVYLINLYSYSLQAFTSFYSEDGKNFERVNNDILNLKNKSVYFID